MYGTNTSRVSTWSMLSIFSLMASLAHEQSYGQSSDCHNVSDAALNNMGKMKAMSSITNSSTPQPPPTHPPPKKNKKKNSTVCKSWVICYISTWWFNSLRPVNAINTHQMGKIPRQIPIFAPGHCMLIVELPVNHWPELGNSWLLLGTWPYWLDMGDASYSKLYNKTLIKLTNILCKKHVFMI